MTQPPEVPPPATDGAAAPSAGRVHALIDKVIAAFADGPWRDEAAAAREEFFARAGKIFEDDKELFDARIAAFLEWYVLERPWQGGPAPIVLALRGEGAGTELGALDREALAWIAASHHSLFEIDTVEGRKVGVRDLLGGARFSVLERRSTIGFQAGDLFEGRLLWDGREIVFGKTSLFHPRDARAEVLEVVETMVEKGTPREEILFLLSRLHVRWHRLGHVGADRIYREAIIRSTPI